MEHTYDVEAMEENISRLVGILRYGVREAVEGSLTITSLNGYVEMCPRRDWHRREQMKYPLHFVVEKAIKMARPADWHSLVLEWPHVSETDVTRLAYTRSEKAAEADKQAVTSVAKYLRANFPTLPDHAVRDLAALASTDGCGFVNTLPEMIDHIKRGPTSCMSKDRWDVDSHPYNVYDPKYGWKLAVHVRGDAVLSRALVIDGGKSDSKYYVRTYHVNDGGYSGRCSVLEAWLESQGYTREAGWDGERLAYISGGDNILAPYLDGDTQMVDVRRREGENVLVICDDGEYECTRQDGSADEANRLTCDDCGDSMHEDNSTGVGYDGDVQVCSCCADSYTVVIGRRGSRYLMRDNEAVWVEATEESYDPDYLDYNDIVELENGSYEKKDDAICIDGDWYHVEDERVGCDEADGEWKRLEDFIVVESAEESKE